jgi:hypothetical protein
MDPDWIWIGIGFQPKMLDPDQMNTDPKHWFQIRIQIRKGKNDPQK